MVFTCTVLSNEIAMGLSDDQDGGWRVKHVFYLFNYLI